MSSNATPRTALVGNESPWPSSTAMTTASQTNKSSAMTTGTATKKAEATKNKLNLLFHNAETGLTERKIQRANKKAETETGLTERKIQRANKKAETEMELTERKMQRANKKAETGTGPAMTVQGNLIKTSYGYSLSGAQITDGVGNSYKLDPVSGGLTTCSKTPKSDCTSSATLSLGADDGTEMTG